MADPATAEQADLWALLRERQPDAEPDFRLVALHLLPATAGPKPTPAFVASVRSAGVQDPVNLGEPADASAPYVIYDGNRRIAAARIVGLTDVPALVLPHDPERQALSGLLANNARSANPVIELEDIRALFEASHSEREIAAATGMAVATIRKRLGLLRLAAPLAAGFKAGALSVGVAEAAAKLPKGQQARLVERLREAGKVTGSDVEDAKQVRRDAAVASLPASLFVAPGPEPEPAPDPGASAWLPAAGAFVQQALAVAKGAEERSPFAGQFADELRNLIGRYRLAVN